MATTTGDELNFTIIWDVIKWFFGGLFAICSILVTTLFGKMYKQHNEMHEWFVSSNDPEKIKLKDLLIQKQQDELEKSYKDIADIKHRFSNWEIQAAPILKRMAEEEITLGDKMDELLSMIKYNGDKN